MSSSFRLIPWLVLLVVGLSSVHPSVVLGQTSRSILPDEAELNRLGLTMAWWSQAAVNARQDQVEFFNADEQNVYVQSSTGIVSSFHGELGRQLWTQLVGQPDQQAYPVTSSDKEVLVTIGLHTYSLDKATGRVLWELELPEYPSTSPQVDEEQIYVGTLDGSVLSYDLGKVQNLYAEGMLPRWTVRARLWNFQTPAGIISPPIPSGNNVLFASGRGVVYSLSAKNKELRFQLETGGQIQTPLGYSTDRIYVASSNARMLCLNQLNGHVLWTFSGGSRIRLQPRVIGPQVFVVPNREGLVALSASSGAFLWQQPLATQLVAVSETRVYASGTSGNLLILDRLTGGMIGMLNLRDFPIRVANDRTDRIYLCSDGGTVIGLREVGSEYPTYHLHPERRPILPELAPEEGSEKEAPKSDENGNGKEAPSTPTQEPGNENNPFSDN